MIVSNDDGVSGRQEGAAVHVSRLQTRGVERPSRHLRVSAHPVAGVEEEGENTLGDLVADDGTRDAHRLGGGGHGLPDVRRRIVERETERDAARRDADRRRDAENLAHQ